MRLKKYTGVSWGEKKKLTCILTLEFNTFSEAAMHFYKAFFFQRTHGLPFTILSGLGKKNKADMPLSLGFVAQRQIKLTVDT